MPSPWGQSRFFLLLLFTLTQNAVLTQNAFAQPRVYVTNEKSDNVSVVDAATDKVLTTISVGKRPRGVVVSPNGKRVYTANGNSNDVSIIDTETYQVIATIPAGIDPEGMAISADGQRLYVVNENEGMLTVMDTATNPDGCQGDSGD